MIELEWEKGGKDRKVFKGTTLVTIGRGSPNDIILDDHKVSAYHAVIVENEIGEYFIRDLGSLNGIKINGQNCLRSMLYPKDSLSVSTYQIKVKKISTTPDDADAHTSSSGREYGEVEIPIADIPRKTCLPPQFIKNTGFYKEGTGFQEDISGLIAELEKVNDLDFFLSQLLKEICDTLMGYKCGYLALFDLNRKLILRKELRVRRDQLPQIPRDLFREMVEDEKNHYAEVEGKKEVALIPLKGAHSLLGVIYLYDLAVEPKREATRAKLSLLIDHPDLGDLLDEKTRQGGGKIASQQKWSYRWKEKFVGNRKTPLMEEVYRRAEELAQRDKPVVILGETGTGKTELARRIHELSRRREKKFIRVDLNTIAETIVESEMFGTTKGGYTGSERERPGVFEHANQGTLFLDEIGNLSLNVQNKLLQPLDDAPFVRRIGSVKEIPIDVRIIAATNKDIEDLVKQDKFKEDLYRRLGIGFSSIQLPPLKERSADIPLLAAFFIDGADDGCLVEGISRTAMRALMAHDWWGNIGTLRSVILQAMYLAHAEGRKVISISDLPEKISRTVNPRREKTQTDHFPSLEEIERDHILRALHLTGNNKTQAAGILGITRPTLNAKMVKYGVEELSEVINNKTN